MAILLCMGYIYLILSDDAKFYKIGRTKGKPSDRLKTLETGTPDALVLVESYETEHTSKLESWLHRHFHDKRVEREWFALDEDDVKNFRSLCEEKEHTIKILLRDNPFFN